MSLIILDDEDQPALTDAPDFRIIVLVPRFTERLMERLIRYWVRRRAR